MKLFAFVSFVLLCLTVKAQTLYVQKHPKDKHLDLFIDAPRKIFLTLNDDSTYSAITKFYEKDSTTTLGPYVGRWTERDRKLVLVHQTELGRDPFQNICLYRSGKKLFQMNCQTSKVIRKRPFKKHGNNK